VLTLIVLDLVSDEEQDDDGSGDVGDALKRNNAGDPDNPVRISPILGWLLRGHYRNPIGSRSHLWLIHGEPLDRSASGAGGRESGR
jgi:hypothetical protein